MASPLPAPEADLPPRLPSGASRGALASARPALAKLAIWLALAVLLAPGAGPPLGTGLDASYLWGVDTLAATGAAHGRDVVFPYGPLGRFLLPHPWSGAFGAGLAAHWALHLLWLAAVALLLRRSPDAGRAAVFAAFVLLAAELGVGPDGRLLLVLATLLALGLAEPGVVGLAAAALAGALAPTFALVRLSLGAAALATTAAFAVLALERPAMRRRGAAAAGGVLAAAGLALLAFPSPGDAWRWLAAQMELARGFGTAMGIPGLPGELTTGLLGLAIYAGLLARAIRTGEPARDLWVVLAPAVLLTFKHGFTRQDGHVVIFFSSLLALIALGLLDTGAPGDRAGYSAGAVRAAGTAALAVLLLAVPVTLGRTRQNREALPLALGHRGVANIAALADLEATARWLDRQSRRALRRELLPRPFREAAQRRGVSADAVPWDLALLPANGLRWVPSPTLQLYTAYTAELDAWAADHFAGARAPDLLLARYEAIDGRNMMWDTPRAWRAILAAYSPLLARPRPDTLALLRRPQAAAWRCRRLAARSVRPGRWIEIPDAPGGWTFAELDLPLRSAGRLAALLLRLPPIEAEVAFARGRPGRWRLVPETAEGGLLVAPVPESLDDLEALFHHREGGRRAVRLRLVGPGSRYLDGDARVVFRSCVLR